IYFGDPVPGVDVREGIVSRCESFVGSMGFKRAYELPVESGSWLTEIWMRGMGLWRQKEVQERVAKLEEAAEQFLLEKPRAEIAQIDAKTVSDLLACVKDQNSCYIDFGSLLIIKFEGKVLIKRLTQEQMKLIEE